jgi:hypothetical protein
VQFPDVTTGALFQNYKCQVATLDKNGEATFSGKKFIEKNTMFFLTQISFQYSAINGLPEPQGIEKS